MKQFSLKIFHSNPNTRKAYLISLIAIFIGLIFTTYSYYKAKNNLNETDLKIGFLLILGFSIMFIKNSRIKLHKQYFNFSLLFIMGFLIIHFQLYLDYLLGNYLILNIKLFKIDGVGLKGFYLGISALLAFYLGYLIAVKRNIKQTTSLNFNIHKKAQNLLIFLNLILLIGFVGFSNFNYFKGNYGNIINTNVATYIEYFLKLALISYIISHSLRSRLLPPIKKSSLKNYFYHFNKIVIFCIIVYSILVISSGDRGPVIYIFIGLFVGYIYSSKRNISLITLGIIAFVSIFSLFLLGYSRAIGGTSNFSLSKLIETKKAIDNSGMKISFSPLTLEYANVLRAYHGGINYVESYGYHYGELNFYNMIGSVPGLGRIYQYISEKDDWNLSSSKIITNYLHGYKSDHGLGTTCIIDIYMDFGFIGVVFGFIVFGFYSRSIDEFISTFSLYNLLPTIMFFVFLINSIYIPRSSISSVFRDGIIIFIIIRLSSIISKIFNENTLRN